MTLAHQIREPAGEPQGALVLSHGRGADEADLQPFLDILDPQKRLLGVTPGGPLHLPPGGRHWYSVPRVGYPDPATFAEGFGALTSFVDRLLEERGIDWSRVILGGFSQGTVMSYAMGLGAGRPLPAGIIALSGFIPTVDGWSLRDDIPQGFPVAISHGTADPVISVEFARAARDTLTERGADVTYYEAPFGHQVDPRFLSSLPTWIERALARSSAAGPDRAP